LEAATADALGRAFASLAGRGVPVLLVSDPLFASLREPIVALAARHRVPTIYDGREFTVLGGLASYGSSFIEAYRLLGGYPARRLDGARPADLPVVQPTTFDLTVNLTTAKSLGISVPPTLLAAATEVIE